MNAIKTHGCAANTSNPLRDWWLSNPHSQASGCKVGQIGTARDKQHKQSKKRNMYSEYAPVSVPKRILPIRDIVAKKNKNTIYDVLTQNTK